MDVSHFWGVDWLDKDTNQWESEFCSLWVLWFSCSQFCTSALCINLAASTLVKYIGVYRLSHPVGFHVLSEWCSRTQLVREDPNNLHIETHTACQEARDGVSFSFWFFFVVDSVWFPPLLLLSDVARTLDAPSPQTHYCWRSICES